MKLLAVSLKREDNPSASVAFWRKRKMLAVRDGDDQDLLPLNGRGWEPFGKQPEVKPQATPIQSCKQVQILPDVEGSGSV